ncbi:hypothetical protein JTE90_026619 [Oedothorax gibbosus]|uniref:Uncharacterized protein n=1 Tax=Oedothorax gibbosus TaxID=931172 RepID=A0AAV6V197_9ARAC|nr:hypothetical protein JTE90_026619 [Oedothorax gibbosus]
MVCSTENTNAYIKAQLAYPQIQTHNPLTTGEIFPLLNPFGISCTSAITPLHPKTGSKGVEREKKLPLSNPFPTEVQLLAPSSVNNPLRTVRPQRV